MDASLAAAADSDSENSPAGAVPHGSFRLTRDFSVPRAAVFRAFAEQDLRGRWFRLPGRGATGEHELDFRVGGGQTSRNVFVSGDIKERLENRSRFLDIVPDARIVLSYEVRMNDVRRWVCPVTVELAEKAGGSRLTWTEQYAYLVVTGDGSQDVAHLKGGTNLLLNGLATVVEPGRRTGVRGVAALWAL